MQLSKKNVQASFSKAAETYDHAAVVQNEILQRLLERLEILHDQRAPILDLGSGTGLAARRLASRCDERQYFALDISEKMLTFARSKHDGQISVCGDAESLPFKENSFGTVFSASTLQWSNHVDQTFSEVWQVLKPDGLFLFSSFGPNTLSEMRECFETIDTRPHVNSFTDMHELGDLMVAGGFKDVVMESETITIEYSDPIDLLRDLQATGATNQLVDRARGLFGRQRMNQYFKEYQNFRNKNGKYPATYEVVYGHGMKQGVLNSRSEEWQPVKYF
ncbi:MAG: malonyl-ACP O-methyltransferase BioC [Pseudomonadota bacterium]